MAGEVEKILENIPMEMRWTIATQALVGAIELYS